MRNQELEQMLREMLQTELEAMDYYQQASRYMQDEGAIFHFNLLAQEELEHARTFYDVYPGDDLPEFEELVSQVQEQQTADKLIDPQLMGRLTEQNALQLAMKMEQTVADQLQKNLKEAGSPSARVVIEQNIASTLDHLDLIKDDYRRLFPAVEE